LIHPSGAGLRITAKSALTAAVLFEPGAARTVVHSLGADLSVNADRLIHTSVAGLRVVATESSLTTTILSAVAGGRTTMGFDHVLHLRAGIVE